MGVDLERRVEIVNEEHEFVIHNFHCQLIGIVVIEAVHFVGFFYQ